jgi:hypothetical protein
MIKAIDTKYKGYRFRSRLEVRWAIYLDSIGIQWVFEPEGYELGNGIRYLPDLWLPELKMFAEVKPENGFNEKAIHKIKLLVLGTGFDCILLDGIPEIRSYKKWGADGFQDVLLFPHPEEKRLYRCAEEMDENQIEMDSPEIFAHLKRSVEASLSSRFEFEENSGQKLATPKQQLHQEQLAIQPSDQNPLLNKPCTQAEIDSYQKFASLPISERRRRVYANYITQFPHSLLTKDVLSGKIDLPKPRKKRVKDKSPKRKSVSKKTEQMLLQIEPSLNTV